MQRQRSVAFRGRSVERRGFTAATNFHSRARIDVAARLDGDLSNSSRRPAARSIGKRDWNNGRGNARKIVLTHARTAAPHRAAPHRA